MAISEMRRVTVLGHIHRMAQVVEAIHALGIMDIIEFGEGMPDDERSGLVVPDEVEKRATELDSIIADLGHALEFLAVRRRVAKGMLENFTGSRIYLTEAEWQSETTNPWDKARQIHAQAHTIEGAIAEAAEAINRLQTSINILEPWRNLDSPVESIEPSKHVVAMLATADVRMYRASLESAQEQVPGLAWQVISEGREKAHLLLAYPASQGEAGASAIAAVGLDRVSLDQFRGLPAHILEDLKAQLKTVETRRAEMEADVDALARLRPTIYALYDYFVNEKAKLDIVHSFGGTKRTFAVEGWVQATHMERLRGTLQALADDIVVLDRPPLDDEVPPVELTNSRLLEPFEVVTKTMGLPQPGTLDPSPYLGPFFLVFFGLAMTDAVYGIFIAAVALWLKRKTRQPNSKFLNLVFMAGLTTVAVGALLGGWLGDLPARLFGIRTAILFDPMESPMSFLILSFALGIVQILFGICLKAYQNIRTGQWLAAIYDQVFWLTFIIGLGLALGGGALGPGGAAVAAVAKYVAIASAIGLVATQGRHHRNPLMRLGSGVLSLYNITGYMSDVISYARLFGLGFTSTVLAFVLNDLMLKPAGIPIIGPVIAVIGLAFSHLFNILINIIGAYVHSCRLQFIEFFGKFFESGGRRFVPFGFSAKYVDIDRSTV
ncbi:MAG: V-type ATPase 116kDa subunit family protein [Bacillota bacterium]